MKKRKNSRAKGARGELELAKFLTERGYDARRGQQFAGGTDSPDVICAALGNYHLEVKRVESINIHAALAQAIRDCGGIRTPLVVHKRNRGEWIAIIRLEDLLDSFMFQ